MRDIFAALTRNPMSLLGCAFALVSGILMTTLFIIEMFGAEGHPYIGIVTYAFLPTSFFAGCVLVVWGIIRERRRSKASAFPLLDFNLKKTRERVLSFLVLVCMSSVILATATYKGVGYMSSTTFCGTTCHSVMSPEYTAYQRSPHARVDCVECHVGPGAGWFVKSKLSGAWQLVSTTFDLYHRPIETPIDNLRPSNATCEQCHWPTKFHGVLPKMITRFAEDEANTDMKTILMLNVGGHDFEKSRGIHWHMDPKIQIRYRSDKSREVMHEVEYTLADGTVKRYFAQEGTEKGPSEWRTMDCIDCHNRPSHIYYGAEESVDLAMERGFIKKDLPWVKREAVRAIRTEYKSHDEARKGISASLAGFYKTEYAELSERRAEDIAEAGRVLGDAYARSVFPTMKVGWGTYPDHIGHTKSPGCFRCHAGNHATKDGETITVDCRTCHTIVAWDEASPQILELLEKK